MFSSNNFNGFINVRSGFCAAFIGALSLYGAAGHSAELCMSSSSDSDGDGWGWENNTSCIVVQPVVEPTECIDSDGDGWGWDGVNSCIVSPPVVLENCVDSPPIGDGWGWNGVESCRIEAEVVASECVDSEPLYDGWGWNGVESCRINDDTGSSGGGSVSADQVDNCSTFGNADRPGTLAYAIVNSDTTIFINCSTPITVPEIVVDSALSIVGGHLDGGGNNRVLHVKAGASAGLVGTTVSGGYARQGAGIFNEGSLNLTSVSVTRNTIDGSSGSGAARGAGIYNTGELSGTGYGISNNRIEEISIGRGAGVFNAGDMHGEQISIANNSVSGEAGGGVYNTGTMEIARSTIAFNRAAGLSGIIPPDVADGGGGVFNTESGVLSFYRVSISSNTTDGDGGGLLNFGDANLQDSFVDENIASGDGLLLNIGGGVANYGDFYLGAGGMDSNISGDLAGGLYNEGLVRLERVTVANNAAFSAGGGIFNRSTVNGEQVSLLRNDSPEGGALWNGGDVELVGSRIESNTGGRGSAIYCGFGDGTIVFNGSISGNQSDQGSDGAECVDRPQARMADAPPVFFNSAAR